MPKTAKKEQVAQAWQTGILTANEARLHLGYERDLNGVAPLTTGGNYFMYATPTISWQSTSSGATYTAAASVLT